jgi:hypothetical protein
MTMRPDAERVRLRPHHLLCVLTYAGRGYTPEFERGFDAVSARLSAGAAIEIVAGADDICAHHNGNDRHCDDASIALRDEHARAAVHLPGDVLDADTVRALRTAFAAGDIRGACVGCDWYALCSQLAADGFADPKLRLRPSTSSG